MQQSVPQNPMLDSTGHYDNNNSMGDDMEEYQSAVLKVFQNASRNSEQGASISEIVTMLPQYTPHQIRYCKQKFH